jgi:hypothetical protein
MYRIEAYWGLRSPASGDNEMAHEELSSVAFSGKE